MVILSRHIAIVHYRGASERTFWLKSENVFGLTLLVKYRWCNPPGGLISILVLLQLSSELIKVLALGDVIFAQHGLPLDAKWHVPDCCF